VAATREEWDMGHWAGHRWLIGALAAVAAAAAVGAAGAAGASQTAPTGSAASAGTATQVSAAAPAYVPPRQVLKEGDHGRAVRKLQRRLAQLKYYPGPIDGKFGLDTLEAVWAFKEVQGINTDKGSANVVGHVMERDLVHPRLPKLLVSRGRHNSIQVNLRRQYLVLYRHSKIELISHVSPGGGYYYPCPGDPSATCGPAITPDGNYRAELFLPGWVTVPLGYMYNPVFFIGEAYAIHGDIPVPLQAVSHGCVRIPMDISQFFHKLVKISPTDGTPVYIRGHVPGT
jgi:peptidoglycan hydrolase-like protein with peptidoglycan-binding domain